MTAAARGADSTAGFSLPNRRCLSSSAGTDLVIWGRSRGRKQQVHSTPLLPCVFTFQFHESSETRRWKMFLRIPHPLQLNSIIEDHGVAYVTILTIHPQPMLVKAIATVVQ